MKHLDKLGLNRRPLVKYLVDAFDLRVPPEVFAELQRHTKGMALEKMIKRKRIEWRVSHMLDDTCLKVLLPNLPVTKDWYVHEENHPNSEAHLFAPGKNAGERDSFLLFLELSYAGHTPILLTDDFKANRLAMDDLIGWKIRTGVLWITLDLVIYLVVTGLKRAEGTKIVNRFQLAELTGVIRDLVLRVSSQKELQQQLLAHYDTLARMVYRLIDSNESFNRLEKKYARLKYR